MSSNETGGNRFPDLPRDWQWLPIRRICNLTTGGKDTQDSEPEGQYPFFVRSQTVERIDSYCFDGEAVLTSGDGAGVGKIYHHYSGKFDFHQRVYLFHSFRKVTGRFLFYYLSELFGQYVWAGTAKSTVESLRRPMIQEFLVAIPPVATQERITAFLDVKAARVDAVIDRKRRLLELLAEKRAALINQAVTKGLDSTVPMKDSGIPWIGEIPAHWEAKRTRFLCSRIKTGTTPPTTEAELYSDGLIPWYAPGSFDSETLQLSEPKALLNERVWKSNMVPRFRKGAVLVVGIGATLGKVAHLDVEGTANQQVLALEFNPKVMDSRFAAYQFKYRETVFRDRALFTTLPIMNQEGIAEHHVLCPSLDEQRAIVVHIEAKLKRMDKTKSLAGQQVSRLQEYRQALITAAVTGQLEIPVTEPEEVMV